MPDLRVPLSDICAVELLLADETLAPGNTGLSRQGWPVRGSRRSALIEALAREGYGTRGNVLAACAYLLELDVKTAEEWGEITPPRRPNR